MGRRRKGLPIHGWLVIDKPLGLTSNAVVGRVRRLTQANKVGHGGTLDPLATGLLPIALGEATKTVSYVMDGTKTYRFTVCWGEERSTDDREGAVLERSDVRPSETEIRAALGGFIGAIEQTPPRYSAIKIDGQRAYALARANKEVSIESRTVRIDGFELIRIDDIDHATFEVRSGKGAYMRSLARDLGRVLGALGHVSMLRRIAIAGFCEADAISLEKLEALGHSAALEEHLMPLETVLDDIPALALSDLEAGRMRNGQAISLLAIAQRNPQIAVSQGDVVCVMAEGKPVALARIEGGDVRPVRVLNL